MRMCTGLPVDDVIKVMDRFFGGAADRSAPSQSSSVGSRRRWDGNPHVGRPLRSASRERVACDSGKSARRGVQVCRPKPKVLLLDEALVPKGSFPQCTARAVATLNGGRPLDQGDSSSSDNFLQCDLGTLKWATQSSSSSSSLAFVHFGQAFLSQEGVVEAEARLPHCAQIFSVERSSPRKEPLTISLQKCIAAPSNGKIWTRSLSLSVEPRNRNHWNKRHGKGSVSSMSTAASSRCSPSSVFSDISPPLRPGIQTSQSVDHICVPNVAPVAAPRAFEERPFETLSTTVGESGDECLGDSSSLTAGPLLVSPMVELGLESARPTDRTPSPPGELLSFSFVDDPFLDIVRISIEARIVCGGRDCTFREAQVFFKERNMMIFASGRGGATWRIRSDLLPGRIVADKSSFKVHKTGEDISITLKKASVGLMWSKDDIRLFKKQVSLQTHGVAPHKGLRLTRLEPRRFKCCASWDW